MKDLFRLYNDVFSKLPVSLVGYNNIIEKINTFFYSLTSDEYFKENDEFSFFSYSLSKLKDAQKWETDLLSHQFFFHDFKGGDPILPLSFYYFLKEKYSINFNTITSLSQLFAKDISFRVSLTYEEKWKFQYDEQLNILSFEIPNSQLKTENYIIAEELFLKKLGEQKSNSDNLYVSQEDSLFERIINKQSDETNEHEEFFKNGFNDLAISSLLEEIKVTIKEFIVNNPNLFVKSTQDELSKLVDYWISQIISIAFLAGIYNCWIEYMPAVVGVFELKDDTGKTYKTEYRNLGSFIIGYSKLKSVSLDDRIIFKLISERISLAVGGEHLKVLMTENEKQATSAAISQVMARNMRHNIGSHVLNNLTTGKALSNIAMIEKISKEKSYQGINYSVINNRTPKIKYNLKKYLEGIIEQIELNLFDEESIEKLLCSIDFQSITNKVPFKYPKGNELLPSNQNAYFNSYINCRMDYLSEVTFGVSTMQTSKKIYSEVFKELDKVRLLLNHISGITDFDYRISFWHNNFEINEKNINNDISIAFPSDILGCHAFYNILENIIRNTAKHCQVKNGITIFSINIFDDLSTQDDIIENISKQYYKVEITDGISIDGQADNANISKEEWEAYCNFLNLQVLEKDWNQINKIDWLVNNQNIKLNKSVLGSNYQLRTNSLGLLEMEASAAFLRQLEMPEIESDDYQIFPDELTYNKNSRKLNIIKAFKAGDSTSGYSLGYRIFLMKPQEILFVGNWIMDENKGNDKVIKSKLENHGIWFKTEIDFLTELESKVIYNHQFVLFDGNSVNIRIKNLFDITNTEDKTIKLRTSLPVRCINVNSYKADICLLLKKNKIDELGSKIWEIWKNKINPFLNVIHVANSPKNYLPFTDFQIVLFDHLIEDLWKEGKENKTHKIWMDALPSSGQKMLPGFQKSSTLTQYYSDILNEPHLISKIFEAYYNKVIVIDERIQNFSNQRYIDHIDISYLEIFEQSNVFIPDKYKVYNSQKVNSTIFGKIELDSKNYDLNLTDLIESFIEVSLSNAQFLLIHYGILERMYKNRSENELNNKLRQWSKLVRVIVTSGRGKQSLNLPPIVYYANLSSVAHAFMENRNKYSINYLLNQARK